MFQTLKNAWKIPELRQKLLFTLLILVLYRLGSALPLPWIQSDLMQSAFNSQGALGWLNLLSGGALSRATLFALSVSPYITASIVVQLLTIAIKKLQEWSKEGEAGRKKLSMLTRGITVGLALVTSIGYTMYIANAGWLTEAGNTVFGKIVLISCYCAGAALIMWMGEKINEKGIGNGISIILFANIISRLPGMANSLGRRCFGKGVGSVNYALSKLDAPQFVTYIVGTVVLLLVLAILLFAVVAVVWFSNSERRIPVQYAKRVVGRKMYGGQSSTLPLKLDMAGVMPVIFSSSIVSIPVTIAGFVLRQDSYGNVTGPAWARWIDNYLGADSFPYLAFFILLIIAFAYFYIMISFDPVEVANNLRSNGGAIPGIRPGRPTIDYIKKILNRITLLGALFLCILCGVPMIVNAIWTAIDGVGIADLAFSGSSLLIVVGVALETFRELEAQMTLRNYKGFLD